MRTLLGYGLWMVLASTALGEHPSADISALRAAISRAIPMLEAGSAGSASERTCFTCHSQAIPVFALLAAQQRGFEVDRDNLERQVQHSLQHLQRGEKNYALAKGQGGGVLTAGYALWTLDEAAHEADETTTVVAHYLLEHQTDQYFWRQRGNRPPTSGSDFTATYVALRGLHYFGTDEQRSSIQRRKEAVFKWIQDQQPGDTEDQVFRLGCLAYLNCDDNALQAAANDLLQQQRSDGGWAQKDDMESDAYATATALVMLMREAHIATSDQRIRAGIDYLKRTQLADGTWHVATRAQPVQEYFESGFPHGKDQFISIAASGWCTLALLQCLPYASPTGDSPRVDK